MTDEISEYLTAISCSLFPPLRCTQANLSYWAPACVCTMSVVWVRAFLLNSALAPIHPTAWVKCLWCKWFIQLWGSFWWCTSLGSAHKNSELCDHLISGPFNTLDRLCSKISTPNGVFSHTIKRSVTFFTHCVGLNVTAAGLTLLEGKRETFSQGCSYISQLGLSVLFVCFSYKPCWYICMIMHFWRCSWMGLSPFCLYSGLSLSQLCIGQRPKFCCLFCANNCHWLLDNTEALGAAYGCVCLGTELKTQSVSC